MRHCRSESTILFRGRHRLHIPLQLLFLHLLCAGLAEFGSEQLEFIKLSDWTGNATYARLVEGNVALLHDKYPDRVRT
jgi:Glycosyl hydrolase family 47